MYLSMFCTLETEKKRKRKGGTSRLKNVFQTHCVGTEQVNAFIVSSHGLSPGSVYICVCMLAVAEVCPTESYMLRSLSWDIWTLCPMYRSQR